jgi:hypothetical protein
MSIKYWSGKLTDPEFLNYTLKSYEEVFKNATWERPTPKQIIGEKEHLEKIKKEVLNETK